MSPDTGGGFWAGVGGLLRAIPAVLWWIGAVAGGILLVIWRWGRDKATVAVEGQKAKEARLRANGLAARLKAAAARGDDAEVQRLAQEQIKQGRKR